MMNTVSHVSKFSSPAPFILILSVVVRALFLPYFVMGKKIHDYGPNPYLLDVCGSSGHLAEARVFVG